MIEAGSIWNTLQTCLRMQHRKTDSFKWQQHKIKSKKCVHVLYIMYLQYLCILNAAEYIILINEVYK